MRVSTGARKVRLKRRKSKLRSGALRLNGETPCLRGGRACRGKFDLFREEKLEEERAFRERIAALEKEHASAIQTLESKFQSKLGLELNRQQKLVRAQESEKAQWKLQTQTLQQQAEERTKSSSLCFSSF